MACIKSQRSELNSHLCLCIPDLCPLEACPIVLCFCGIQTDLGRIPTVYRSIVFSQKGAEIGVTRVRDISLADMDSGMMVCIVVCMVLHLSPLGCLPDLR